MDYDLTRYGFKKVGLQWYFYTDNSHILHICDPTPDQTGDYPKKQGWSTPEGRCSSCSTEIPGEYMLLLNLQQGLGGRSNGAT
jgi:hypothetical protein